LSGSAARVETLALLRLLMGSKLSSTLPSRLLEVVDWVGDAWVHAMNASIGANKKSILEFTVRPPIQMEQKVDQLLGGLQLLFAKHHESRALELDTVF
jgi:hypothetical protein